jgi:hypothetical protein
MVSHIAQSFFCYLAGYAISTLTSSVETATALGPVVMLPLLLFGGFFVNNE